ncbi:Anion/proton exchange transporter GEF1 [Rhodotorula toruloides]|nr:Anion/proton exchange transporter GEF1 [Rhodotorula toruloides]
MARSKGRKNAQQSTHPSTDSSDRSSPSQATPHEGADRPASPTPSNATTADEDDMDDFEDAQGGEAASRAGGSDDGDEEPADGQVGNTRDDGAREGRQGAEVADDDVNGGSTAQGDADVEAHRAVDGGRSGDGDGDDSGHSSPDRAPTPTLSSTNPSSATGTTAGRTSSPPSSRPTSVASSSGIEGLRQGANRLSLALSDDSTGERDDADDANSSSKRPFSLSSAPETPTSPSASSSSAPHPPPLPRHRSSLLASSLSGPAQDPTNVGREASASLTQAVWRQSLGLNASPGAKGLVDVVLSDNEEEGEEGEEGPSTPRRRGANGSPAKRRSVLSSSAGDDDSHYGDEDLDLDAEADESRDSFPSPSSSHSPSKFTSTANPRFPRTSAHLMPSSPSRDRQGSIATPHAADGFISHRASTNLSSTTTTSSPDLAPKASNGIQKLQNEFLKVKEQEGGAEREGIDWDFWGRVMNDYEEVARTQPRELSRAIQRGIPPALRGMVWQLMAAAKDENLEFVYSELLKQSSPHEKSIARDLSRTFPKHEYFSDAQGVGQENLFNVVKAYSLYDDEVGYTQGLQFIVGPLLLNMPDEEAFCVLVRLMKAYDLRSHYTPNMPGLQLRLFQFDRLVEELLPSVFLHLLRQGVKSSMYASQWFLTLFGYRFPLELVSSVFDLVFAEGVEAVFRFAIALLKRSEPYLLTLEFEELIDFLKNGLFEVYAPDEEELERDPQAQYKVHEFVREALQVRITPMMLDQFGEEWANLCAAQTAHAAELDSLRKANLQLSLQVRQLETSLAQINQEHCELVKQVVASRLEREELEDELVKYEDFTTIDWVADTLLERSRRRYEAATATRTLGHSLKAGFWRVVEAGQSWGVVSLVGAIIGLNAALMSIMTAWLSDLKLGYCTQGWWLNRKFCCWEIEEGFCEDWVTWTGWSGVQWVVYVLFAGLFAFSCAFLVRSFAPYAAGSGISEIKCILAGFIINGYLSFATLSIKSLTLPIAIASGLSVGKEGPSVHVASAIGNVVASRFSRFKRSQAKMREIVTAASATGVAVAFGSPIGGVLFSLEEMTINWPIKTMWRSFFCALVANVVLSAMNPFRTGKIVLFQVRFDRDWHFFELGFFILIGVFGGLYGAFVIKYNLQVAAFRRKHLANNAISEAVTLAVLTAAVGFTNRFLRIDMNEMLDVLFRECENGGDYENLCQTWAQWRMVNSLLLATVIRTCLVIVSYGCKVPAGIFVPSMAVGATFGRMVGILVKAMYRAHPTWSMFAACDPEKPCITPGTYAFLGAAAGLAGITRITVTVVVIMFELTGALTYILPTMIVVMVTKAVSDQFGGGGIADQMIRFNGYPLLENHDHAFGVPVTTVMRKELVCLPSQGMKLDELQRLLDKTKYQGFPVVKSRKDKTLLGDISRRDLEIAIEKAQLSHIVAPDAPCLFCPQDDTVSQVGSPSLVNDDGWGTPPDEWDGGEEGVVDFTSFVNQTPLTVSPKQPLEFVMQLFRRMGPRVILVERFGELIGLVSVKDCLRYTIAHEAGHDHDAAHSSNADELEATLEELRLWWRDVRRWIAEKVTGRTIPPSPEIQLDGAAVFASSSEDAGLSDIDARR